MAIVSSTMYGQPKFERMAAEWERVKPFSQPGADTLVESAHLLHDFAAAALALRPEPEDWRIRLREVAERVGDPDLRAFYRLYLRTMRKHRTLPRSLRQLRLTRDLLTPG